MVGGAQLLYRIGLDCGWYGGLKHPVVCRVNTPHVLLPCCLSRCRALPVYPHMPHRRLLAANLPCRRRRRPENDVWRMPAQGLHPAGQQGHLWRSSGGGAPCLLYFLLLAGLRVCWLLFAWPACAAPSRHASLVPQQVSLGTELNTVCVSVSRVLFLLQVMIIPEDQKDVAISVPTIVSVNVSREQPAGGLGRIHAALQLGGAAAAPPGLDAPVPLDIRAHCDCHTFCLHCLQDTIIEENVVTDRGAGFAIESADTAAFVNTTFRKNVSPNAAGQPLRDSLPLPLYTPLPCFFKAAMHPSVQTRMSDLCCHCTILSCQVAALRGGGGWCNSPQPVQLFVSNLENNTATTGGGLFAHGNCT